MDQEVGGPNANFSVEDGKRINVMLRLFRPNMTDDVRNLIPTSIRCILHADSALRDWTVASYHVSCTDDARKYQIRRTSIAAKSRTAKDE
jgi:hypothetical protein